MDDINGIPLMWNDDEDLFRSIRQKADNNFLAAKMNKSVEEISVFNNSPFSGTSNLVKAFAFQNLRPEEVHSNRFQGIKPQQSGPIQMIQDPDCDCGLVPKVTPVYLEANKKSGYQPGEDRLVGNIWVFTSTDKAKLAACYKEIGMPKPDQAFLFYFNRKGAEKGILQAKLGTDLVNKVKLSLDLMEKNQMDFFKNFDQDGNILVGFLKKQTLASDYPLLNGIVNVIGELIANAAGFVSNIIGMGCSYIGKLLQDHLTIPEHVWDSEHGNYTFKSLKESDLLPKKEALLQALQIDDKRMGGIADGMAAFTKTVRVVRQNYMVAQMQMGLATVKNMVMQYNAFIQVALDELYDTLDAQKNVKRYVTGFIANICGIWNGVLDFVAGVFVFLGMVGETPYDFWSDLTLDTFVDYAQSIYRFFSSGLGNLISAAWESTRKLWNDVQRDGIEAINTDKVVYSVAFTTIFIGTFFIPGLEGAHASKALKFVKGLMPERFLEELAVQTGKLNKLGNKVGVASKTLLDDFTKLAAQGKSALSKFFDDICEKIRKWFLKKFAREAVENAKLRKKFVDFVKRWAGKGISGLTKQEILDNLVGYTEQGNKIAKLIENDEMVIKILDDVEFEKELIEAGYSTERAKRVAAFNIGEENFFRASKSADNFLSELIHEGTHTLDNLEVDKLKRANKSQAEIDIILGNNHSFEKRAYFHERAFQHAVGMESDFKTIEEMLEHIRINYEIF